jgi:hypothetical protein
VKEVFTKFLKVGGCKTLFFHLMIFFLNKNTDFCWEIVKIIKSWGGAHPPAPRVRHIPDSTIKSNKVNIQTHDNGSSLINNIFS